MTPGALQELSRRQSARMGENGEMAPEPLADIALRARYAGEWQQDRAARHLRDGDVMRRDDEGMARYEYGAAWGREDAARILLSIADALDKAIGTTWRADA